MTKKKRMALLCGMLVATTMAYAQDDEPQRFTYATYHYCDTSNEQLADDFVMTTEKPVMDKLVDNGTFLGWGWIKHHTGGQWRRIRYYQTDSLNAALDGLEKMGAAFEDVIDDDDPGIGVSCKRHDDYIWQVKACLLYTSDAADE